MAGYYSGTYFLQKMLNGKTVTSNIEEVKIFSEKFTIL